MILPEWTARKEAGVSPSGRIFFCALSKRETIAYCLQTTFSSDDKQAHS